MNITPLVNAFIALAAVIITAFIIPFIRSKTTAVQLQQINTWVRIAVTAAEQIITGSGKGQDKKEYVLNFLEQYNITIDEDQIDALIEAAVYQLKNGVLVKT